MKLGHKKSQELFFLVGEKLGYSTRLTYSPSLPTDGIWFVNHPLNLHDDLPVLAIEVVVSESPKSIRGSIRTLENVSPLLAIMLVHEGEIINRYIRKGAGIKEALKEITKIKNLIEIEVSKSHQRFEIWNEHTLNRWHENVTHRLI